MNISFTVFAHKTAAFAKVNAKTIEGLRILEHKISFYDETLLSSERVLTAFVHAFVSALLTVVATLLGYQVNGREEEEAGECRRGQEEEIWWC
jgi:hypothetical protein